MTASVKERILLVDDNPIFCSVLAEYLRSAGYDVVTAATGEQAFTALRNWNSRINWLYSRATLPGLLDGWILADEYHCTYPDRPVVVSAAEARSSTQRHIVLKQPTPAAAFEVILSLVDANLSIELASDATSGDHQYAA